MARNPARRGLVGRALVSLVVLAASVYLLITTAPRLGLDLRGGTQITLETKDSPTTVADAAATDRALEVLRRRVDALGVAEPLIARSGENRIIIELPGLQDPREAVEVIGRTAQLTFHSITPDGTPTPDEDGNQIPLAPAAFTGEGVESASSSPDPQGVGYQVNIDFSATAARQWEELTGKAACSPPGDPGRRVAIVLDGDVISSPQVDPSVQCEIGMIGNNTRITGQFSAAEAKDLSLLINGGALPVPVEIIEQRTVGPTLGAEAIDASARAAVIGLALTALFLIFVYRFAGLLAVIALIGYAAVAYGALIAIGATLTLPGLAGFVLAIGMAVDATVLVFERAREERGAIPQRAIDRGYSGAWSAIIDSNVTTLLAAALLFGLASGPVRGFGVTLTIGVLAALFSTLILARVLFMLGLRERMGKLTGLAHRGRVREWVDQRDAGFLRKPARWLLGAGAAMLIALVGLVAVGPTLGLEFTGGRVLEYTTPGPVDVDRVRAEVAEAGFTRAVVQESGDNTVSVRTEPIDQAEADRVKAAVAEAAGGAEQLRDEQIGPSLGDELRTKALIALGLAVLAQLIYLAIRFNWRLGLATVIALAQDVLIVVGAFAWLGKPFDGVFLAALLTVIGYSVNDSVVVFDRVRELRGQNRKTPFADVVGRAVLQTLPRTVNTGIGVLFVLGALLFLGDGSLSDFALALLLGLIAGTASTVVTAGPAAIMLDRRFPPPVKQPVKERPRAGDRTDGAVV
ncbi:MULTISPECIES: protein translocase subunit SecD [Actinokineospora]|uniref:Multifunctional fusion protein n=1 Tax=Actinokineospora fastidiosa TaxID=1816 RepID=A0A918GF32_9PSEU|nr:MULTISPECIES: protein translocase subunit SecD [Actinokineospora]UVS79890.1 bifunctional preprotein translocase subunit SecD/SecF [Actinokineospora sp. UTMC 2448]GGS31562.1 protein translocase subunit SecDF [Actinokineospora fastidiosa]